MKFILTTCLIMMGCISLNLSAQAAVEITQANRVAEISFQAEKSRANPFLEIELDVVFTDPRGTQKTVPAFWAGADQWKARYASPILGTHHYRTQCSDTGDGGLHEVEGRVEIIPYYGENRLYRHGPIQVAPDRRHFEHVDGTPFFWLGDTWWKGLCQRLTWEGFQDLTANRKKKGFNVVQIVCGTYPDELGLLQPSWENEGGMPYLKTDFSVMNPEYFDYADRRFEHLINAGIVPAIVGGWGRAVEINAVGLDGYKRHYRNLIARYGAYPVVWILGGETKKQHGPWYVAAEYLDATDPYGRLLTNHSNQRRQALEDHDVFDFDMDATGHRGWETVNNAIQKIIDYRDVSPTKPVLTGEACYEQHMQGNFADLQRYLFWGCILSGAAGHTYGAAGIWHMGVPGEHGNWGGWDFQPYDLTTWREGMHFAGAAQLGRAKSLLEEYPWHRFEPHPEWVGEGDPKKRPEEYDGFASEARFAAGIPGEVMVIYQPKRNNYVWDGITVQNIEPGDYSTFYFDPVSGRRFDHGVVNISGTWTSPNVPTPQDWVMVMEKVSELSLTNSSAFETDRYGGNLEIKREATGFFRIEDINGRWMLVTPEGHGYVALGANHVGQYLLTQSREMGFLEKHDDDMDQGAQALLELIKDLGLNAGSSFQHEPRHAHSLPRIARLFYAPGRDRLGLAGLGPDVFDEGELKKLRAFIIQEVKQYADDPWVIGISASNIPPWDDRRMERVRAAPPGSPMRKRYQEFVMERYPDIASYNRVYEDKLSSFDRLSSEKELKPFPRNKRTREDNDAFLAIIADRLYATVRSAIKTGAPNHLFLGESVIFRTLPDSVLKAIGPYIDAYSAQVIMRSYGAQVIMESPNQLPHWQIFDEEAYKHVHKLTGNPVIIDDWVASFSLADPFDTKTEAGIFFEERRATEQATEWLLSAIEQPYILAVFKCQLIGLHGADRAFDGKSRRTYYKDDGSPYRFRTEMTKQAHAKALEIAYSSAMKGASKTHK